MLYLLGRIRRWSAFFSLSLSFPFLILRLGVFESRRSVERKYCFWILWILWSPGIVTIARLGWLSSCIGNGRRKDSIRRAQNSFVEKICLHVAHRFVVVVSIPFILFINQSGVHLVFVSYDAGPRTEERVWLRYVRAFVRGVSVE